MDARSTLGHHKPTTDYIKQAIEYNGSTINDAEKNAIESGKPVVVVTQTDKPGSSNVKFTATLVIRTSEGDYAVEPPKYDVQNGHGRTHYEQRGVQYARKVYPGVEVEYKS